MIKEKIAKLFTKNKMTNNAQNEEKNTIDSFIKDITDILDIECPSIISVACIFESNNQVQVLKEFQRNDLPDDANFIGAYYQDDQNKIFLPSIYLLPLRDGFMDLKNITLAENLYNVTHELRHVWQKKYHEDIYYKTNAVKMEAINDIAEIDADAFAIAYVLSDKTHFTYEDMPNYFEEICLQATIDNGKRWQRAYDLVNKYHFTGTEKIEDAKNNVNYQKIKNLIVLMKLNGML